MIDMQAYKARVEEAVAFLGKKFQGTPEVLIQTGTGLGEMVEGMEVVCSRYNKIPTRGHGHL